MSEPNDVSPEFASATTTAQFVEINGNRLAVEVLGSEGAPVILTHHGAPGLGSRAEPRASFGRLADEYRVVVFDARGSGESEGNGEFSHEQWAADLDGLREWIGAEQVVVAGGSYGGFMSLEYAIRYPTRVQAVVLRDTAAVHAHSALARENALTSDRVKVDMEKFDRIDEGRVRDNDDLRDCWREILPLYDYVYDPDAVERKVAATPYRYEAHNYAFSRNLPGYDLRAQLPTITAPTLVTVGRTDWITPVSCSEEIAKLIPGARLEIFEKSGHSPQIEQAEEWTAVVREFLHGVVPPGGCGQYCVRMLDTLDELDRRIVLALQLDGRASWTAIADQVGSSTATVARRGQQLTSDGVVRIAVIPARGSLGRVDTFLVRLTCRPGEQVKVAEELAAHESVRFLTLVTGEFDIIAEIVVQGGAAHYPRLIAQLQSIPSIRRWRSDLIMRVYKVSYDWTRQLLSPDSRPPVNAETQTPLASWDVDADTCEPGHLDEADWRILGELRDDARSSFQSVAERTGMNESSVRRRFDRMRRRNCLHVMTVVSAGALGMGAETLLILRVTPGMLESVATALMKYPEARYIASVLDDNSLLCEIITSSVGALNDFLLGIVARLEGVDGWTGAMELLYLKRGFVETPWWRAQLEQGGPFSARHQSTTDTHRVN